ncbi:ABC transporter substrate-binding protein [Pseudomonas mangiferae]|uniref:ABC transporter substrate-binding protein n=1 Tax=Pseudomonas mangiferae TaxID=2593654 RepID=A0A553H393_9PSED|nr:ABC transporter substrate-binding protein [Pseudomonas mangiferae]TRX76207.1 ABC transporter substrate-binding protein [Pseudomonas mangiferae]
MPFFRNALSIALLAAGACVAQAKPLVVCTEASPDGFDIAQYTTAVTADASAETLYDRLVRFTRGTTQVEPGLAERWEISPDGLTYTFFLRKGVKFHTTEYFKPTREFNADDVLWSFERQRDAKHPWHDQAARGFPFFESMEFGSLIGNIEKLDPYTVRFTLTKPQAPFLADLAMGFTSIYSAEYADALLKADTLDKLNSQPVGTGPFVFQRYAKDAQIRFKANPDYWDGVPPSEKLLFSITPDSNVRLQQLRAGACQIALYPRPFDVPGLRKDDKLAVLEMDSLLTSYVGINAAHPPLDDVRVRQAINLAVDGKAYIDAVFGPDAATQAVNPYPSTMLGYDDSITPWPHDPERAKKLLEEAGHKDGFKLTIFTRPGGGPTNPNPALGAQMLQADLKAVGIEAEIRVIEWGEMIKRAKAGEHDLVFMGWAGDNGDPDNFLSPNLSCAAVTSGENYSRWCDKAFDSLITQARENNDPEQRAALYRKSLAIFHEQAPWIPQAHPRQFTALSKDVDGFVQSPLGSNNFAKTKRK